jgi:preprotein translocase subunit SecG
VNSFLSGLITILMVISSIFLIFLVLIQRGKGGGLAGAFGGAGGSSAFGTKAGDVFTKVTMYVAGIWIALAMVLVLMVNRGPSSAWGEDTGSSARTSSSAAGGKKAGKGEVESAPAGTRKPSGSSKTAQPINPGDPLAPLPTTKKDEF